MISISNEDPEAQAGSVLPVRRRLSKGAREQQIMDVAEQLFIDRGFAETSIEDICRAAGITRPIVYEHFGGKDGVYLACVRRARRSFEQEIVDPGKESLPLRDDFARQSRTYFRLLARDPQRWELLFARNGLLGDSLAGHLAEERKRTIHMLAQLYQRFAPDAHPSLVLAAAYAISGSAEQLGRWWLEHPHVSLDEVTAINLEFMAPVLESLASNSFPMALGATGLPAVH